MADNEIPNEHRALVIESVDSPPEVKILPTPKPSEGSAIVRVLAASVLSYHGDIYNGRKNYSFPTPLVGGVSAIGRIAAVGPDATQLQPGQLVYADCTIRGRDDPSAVLLSAIHNGSSEGSRKLMRDVWRNGAFAEYVKMPLENCIPLNEQKLCSDLGYTVKDLAYMATLLVPFGGLRDISVEPGETVIVCPATGNFGGGGVLVAAALGAKVIAMGRNEKELARLKGVATTSMPRTTVETVQITQDVAVDTEALRAAGTIDAILDLSPTTAADSTHLTSALTALRHEGRVSIMGFPDVTSSAAVRWKLVGDNITIKGRLMYSRADILQFVKMMENGLFPVAAGLVDTKAFPLEEWETAFNVATEWTGIGRMVVLIP